MSQICLYCKKEGGCRFHWKKEGVTLHFCNHEHFKKWKEKKKQEKKHNLIIHLVDQHRVGKYEDWLSWDIRDLQELHKRIS